MLQPSHCTLPHEPSRDILSLPQYHYNYLDASDTTLYKYQYPFPKVPRDQS